VNPVGLVVVVVLEDVVLEEEVLLDERVVLVELDDDVLLDERVVLVGHGLVVVVVLWRFVVSVVMGSGVTLPPASTVTVRFPMLSS